ncbi:hypothetical protein [Luteimonas sp. 100069]|uniref:sulfotransferase family protein n=1 Tax=Luteimonas sp. 100069 TaxID=2006109 RepID=UPI000F4DA998|nr:hypothetical protein [Luteimonas sp. 100069]
MTGLLHKLGAELGSNLLPPTRDNPKGYFENQDVVTAHETLLASLGCSWQNPRSLPDGWRTTAAADDAHDTLSQLLGAMASEADLVAVKDPRACRVASLWVDVARAARMDLGAALMVRHPTEVAASLHKRDGLSYARAHLLWIVYLLEAERQTRGVPRAFLSYETLLADWRGMLESMRAAGLGNMLPAPSVGVEEEIDAFLDLSLRRHEATAGVSETSPFESLAVELYGLALRCASMDIRDIEVQFDDVAQRLRPLAARYLEAPLQLEQAIERQRSDQAQLNATMQLAALRELWRPALPASEPGSARLYYRSEGANFGEAEAVSAYPEVSGARRVVTFELAPGTSFDYLRFDPDNVPGVYAIESVSVDGETVASLAALIQGVNERPVPTMRPSDIVRFAALGDDPHFVFDARTLKRIGAADDGRRVRVEYRFETVMSEVGGYLEDYRESLVSHARELAEWQSQVGAAVRKLSEQEARIDRAMEVVPQVLERQLQAGLAVAALDARSHALAESIGNMQTQLASIREQQELVSVWARRRSLGYWWRRLTGALSK